MQNGHVDVVDVHGVVDGVHAEVIGRHVKRRGPPPAEVSRDDDDAAIFRFMIASSNGVRPIRWPRRSTFHRASPAQVGDERRGLIGAGGVGR